MEDVRYLLQSHLGEPMPVKLAKYRRKIIFLLDLPEWENHNNCKTCLIFTLRKGKGLSGGMIHTGYSCGTVKDLCRYS